MNKKSLVFATFLALSTLLTSGTAFAQSVQTTTLPAPYQNYYQFNSDCNLGTRTLKVGSKGRYVWTLESLINLDRGLRSLPDLIADGNYNSVTKKAVREMQNGVLGLDGTGIVDSETREALVDFCYQYVGRSVPRVIQNNNWDYGYNAGDRAFIEKFNNRTFSQYGINKMKKGQSYVFKGMPIPSNCPIGMNCPQVIRFNPALGVRVESVSISDYQTTCKTTSYGTSYCPSNNNKKVSAKLSLVTIDESGNITSRTSRSVFLDKVYNYNTPVYDSWGTATTGNAYVPRSVTEFGDYRIILQKEYGESGVEIDVQNISQNYIFIEN